MVNKESISANARRTVSPSHVRPDYSSYCFANIPGSILNLFDIPAANQLPAGTLPDSQAFDKVIFIFIDAFGWNLFQQERENTALLKRFLEEGIVSQLTAQFPSTTTAHVTTMHTNQPVGEHGLYEWRYYEPQAGALITPLLFSFASDKERETLHSIDLKPEAIFPQQNIYPLLSRHQVSSVLFSPQDFAYSPYNRIVNRGASQQVAYADIDQALDYLSEVVAAADDKAYFFLYYGGLDVLSHKHGPDSAEAAVELRSILAAITERIVQRLNGRKDTLLLIGTDHGQDRIYPKQAVYLNRLLPEITKVFKLSNSGQPLVPGGSCKDFFLYIHEEALESALGLLSGKLDGIAQVMRVDDLISQGYFGQPVAERFLKRVGNVVIVPNVGEAVWWYEPGRYDVDKPGFHGGLTENEMLIPLLALPL